MASEDTREREAVAVLRKNTDLSMAAARVVARELLDRLAVVSPSPVDADGIKGCLRKVEALVGEALAASDLKELPAIDRKLYEIRGCVTTAYDALAGAPPVGVDPEADRLLRNCYETLTQVYWAATNGVVRVEDMKAVLDRHRPLLGALTERVVDDVRRPVGVDEGQRGPLLALIEWLKYGIDLSDAHTLDTAETDELISVARPAWLWRSGRSCIAVAERALRSPSSAAPGVTEGAREALLALAAIYHGDVPERHAPEVWAQVIKAHDLLLAALAGSPTVLTPRSAASSPAPTDNTRWQGLTAEGAITELEERLANSHQSRNVLRTHIVAAMTSDRGNSQAILLRALAVSGIEPRRPRRARRRARRLLLQAAEILEDRP